MSFITALELIIIASLSGYFFTKLGLWSIKKYLGKSLADFNETDIQKLDMSLGISAALPLLLFSFTGAVLNPSAFSFLFVYLASILSCLIMIGFFRKRAVKTQLWGLTLLCFVGTFFFPCSMLVHGFAGLGAQILITFFWMLFLYAFIQLDRVPFLSAWLSFGYMTLVLLLFDAHTEAAVSNFALILLAFSCGIVFYLKSVISPRLGITSSVFIGFLWGFFISYPMAVGNFETSLYAGGYLFLELAYGTLLTLLLTKTIFPIRAPFLIERALLKNVKPEKALQFVMIMNVILCVLGFYQTRSTSSLKLGMLAFLLFFIAYKLLQWGKKRVRFRDLFSDVKQGLITLIQGEKQQLKEIAQRKEQTVIPTTPVQKTVKKAPVKKAPAAKKTVQKTPVKKAPVVKKAVTKTPTVQKTAPKKTVAKKTVAKKTVIKKTVIKKAPQKGNTVKKKMPVTKKAPAKNTKQMGTKTKMKKTGRATRK